MHQPVDEGVRTFTGWLGTIARKPHMCPIRYLSWKAMPKELKEECWCLVEIESEKNKDLRSKQDDLHSAGSRIRGEGFGPSPSARSSKSTAFVDSQLQSSEARDNEVAQLKTSLATMEEKLACFDEMKESLT
ncbi:hypothetical protein SO802_033325 [Lithocarpus litseifolius]|uniref:Uncharacterized protein n=1 Tax=Lithocarpus litseifolius TaxID=425828 RepID=A0AAW2BFZ5_9ROSI